MKNYEYIKKSEQLLTPHIVSLLTKIHEFKGEQNLFIESNADKLSDLLDMAIIQSTESSNRIEGIYTSNERLKKIVMEKTMPKSRDEREIAGYRDVLNQIHHNHDYITISSNSILRFHGDLYKFTGEDCGGKYKTENNVIAEYDAYGNMNVRFVPVEYSFVPEAIDQICTAYNEAIRKGVDPLLVMPMFILDFLCIHPFQDGNGRMSRLLTLLMLYKSDYIVGKYISIEKQIENTKNTYYEVLRLSSDKWHENSNRYDLFVTYYLGVIVSSYREFSERVQTLIQIGATKPERIEKIIRNHLGKISKAEIMKLCPDISQTTVQRTLMDLLDKKKIKKIGGGRYTYYVWNEEGM